MTALDLKNTETEEVTPLQHVSSVEPSDIEDDEDEAANFSESEREEEEEEEENAPLVRPRRTAVALTPDQQADPRFNPPPPALYKRLLLIGFVGLLFFLAFVAKRHLGKPSKPSVVYANRYSKEYKFRPAASPIITETLKDGRTRLRGAPPTLEPLPTPTQKAQEKKKKKVRKGGRGKKAKLNRKPKAQ